MLNKNHVKISEALYLFYNISPSFISLPLINHPHISLTTTLMEILGIYIGSQLPDIDNPSSKIGQIFKPISKILVKFGHRGITHSVWCMTIMLILMSICKPTALHPLYICIAIGIILHILEDSLSKAGIVWFFPFGHYRMLSSKYAHCICRTNINTTFRYKVGGKLEASLGQLAIILVYVECAFYIYFSLT